MDKTEIMLDFKNERLDKERDKKKKKVKWKMENEEVRSKKEE